MPWIDRSTHRAARHERAVQGCPPARRCALRVVYRQGGRYLAIPGMVGNPCDYVKYTEVEY